MHTLNNYWVIGVIVFFNNMFQFILNQIALHFITFDDSTRFA